MAFWNDLGKGLKEAGKKIEEGAKKVGETFEKEVTRSFCYGTSTPVEQAEKCFRHLIGNEKTDMCKGDGNGVPLKHEEVKNLDGITTFEAGGDGDCFREFAKVHVVPCGDLPPQPGAEGYDQQG
jgi:hypothetical protein